MVIILVVVLVAVEQVLQVTNLEKVIRGDKYTTPPIPYIVIDTEIFKPTLKIKSIARLIAKSKRNSR